MDTPESNRMKTTTTFGSLSKEGSRRRWLALVILALSLLLVILDATIINVAIPSIQNEFSASLSDVEWVNSIYSLIFAMTLILWGKLGDVYGRRRLFLAGLLLFGSGSMLSGRAVSIQMLIGMRVLQALGAAMLFPTALAIINSTFFGKERAVAFSIWGMTAGVGAALGPLLGGWVVTNATWRWGFYVNIPVVIIAFLGALVFVKESRSEGSSGHLDVLGALLGGLGMGGIIFGLIEGQNYGWWKPKSSFTVFGLHWPFASFSIIPFSIIGGSLLIFIFIWYEMRLEREGREPLFEFSLFKYRSYRFGLGTLGILALGQFGLIFALSLYLQSVQGLSAWETGLAIVPLALTVFVMAPIGGQLVNKVGAKPIVLTGMILDAAALFWLSTIINVNLTSAGLRLPLLLYGAGIGLANSQINNIILSDVPAARSGIASAGSSTIRRVGSALGIAIVGTVLATTFTHTAQSRLESSQFLSSSPAYGLIRDQIVQKLQHTNEFGQDSLQSLIPQNSGAPAQAAPSGKSQAGQPTAPPLDKAALGQEVTTILKEANAEAVKNVGWVATLFIALGALSAVMLPNPDFTSATMTNEQSSAQPENAKNPSDFVDKNRSGVLSSQSD
jgi:EmrB/QacA subfamily drug resistance transporter